MLLKVKLDEIDRRPRVCRRMKRTVSLKCADLGEGQVAGKVCAPVAESEGYKKAKAVLVKLNVEVIGVDGGADGAELVQKENSAQSLSPCAREGVEIAIKYLDHSLRAGLSDQANLLIPSKP